uniref:Putative secreted protein n=1 Tax=Anopheles darlingi TaxID=43151 RepID=A0A2M4DE96_ANODA
MCCYYSFFSSFLIRLSVSVNYLSTKHDGKREACDVSVDNMRRSITSSHVPSLTLSQPMKTYVQRGTLRGS